MNARKRKRAPGLVGYARLITNLIEMDDQLNQNRQQ